MHTQLHTQLHTLDTIKSITECFMKVANKKGEGKNLDFVKKLGCLERLAEREGFEPPVTGTPQRFSRPPLSTTQPSLYFKKTLNFYRKYL